MNTKVQSNIGLGQAIAYFTGQGYAVSIPLTESQRYDIVVDIEGVLKRVEVKTTSYVKNNNYCVTLATAGGNQSWNKVKKKISKLDTDLVFVYTLSGDMYCFPIELLDDKASLILGDKCEKYKLN